MIRDARVSLRGLAASPGFTAVVLLTLALGIGANTAIFSVLDAVVLRPLPYREPQRLALLWEASPAQGLHQVEAGGATFQDWQRRADSFESLAAYRHRGYTYDGPEEPVRVPSLMVTPSLFPLLGAEAALGRTFTPAEGEPGNEHLVILGHDFWQARLGGDEGIVGSSLRLDGEPHVVVGVMPPGFRFPPGEEEVQVWSPLTLGSEALLDRAHRMYTVLGRLAPGVSLDTAREELRALAAEIAAAHPDTNDGWTVELVPAHEQLVGEVRGTLWILAAAVGLVLLIGCANIASLLVARTAERERELAVRASLGAGRLRLVRLVLVESLLLAAGGGAAGVVLAVLGVGALRGLLPADVPRIEAIGIDPRVLAFTALASALTGLLFGTVPAARVLRSRPASVLQESARGTAGGRRARRVLGLMVLTEVALAAILLVGAGLLIRSFARLSDVDPGFRADDVVTVAVSLPESRYPDAASMRQFFNALVDRTAELPGVESVGAVTALPMSPVGMDFDLPFEVKGREAAAPTERPRADYRSVIPGYFRALGIPLVRGRLLDDFDRDEGRPVMLINETMARRYFADVDPVGQRLGVPMAGEMEIVGVVGDVLHAGLQATAAPEMFVPYQQFALREMHVAVRSSREPAAMVRMLEEQVWALDPEQPVTRAATMAELVDDTIAGPRFNTALLVLMASLAAVLAAVGIYGVVAYSVTRRTGEVGIRMALGAAAADARRLVVGEALRWVAAGLALGLVAALLAGRALGGLLFGIGPRDPVTYLAVIAVVASVGLVSALVPAARVVRIDPVEALREE